MSDSHAIQTTINQQPVEATVSGRMLLSDFLRDQLGLTGTHVGCEHGVCGACTILFDGLPARSCLLLAVQAHQHEIVTVEGLAADGKMHPLQEAFKAKHALQCGYCTPGFLMTLVPFLADHPDPDERDVRDVISGNLCRCTGYQNIVDATLLAAQKMRESSQNDQAAEVGS